MQDWCWPSLVDLHFHVPHLLQICSRFPVDLLQPRLPDGVTIFWIESASGAGTFSWNRFLPRDQPDPTLAAHEQRLPILACLLIKSSPSSQSPIAPYVISMRSPTPPLQLPIQFGMVFPSLLQDLHDLHYHRMYWVPGDSTTTCCLRVQGKLL